MKKIGLKDMKKRNSLIILDLVCKLGPLSRVEIARYTELSPSTVTAQVNNLIEKGLLVESGTAASTGGRKRIELSMNSSFGDICIVEMERRAARLRFYDMNLNEYKVIPLAEHYLSGNDLLELIISSIPSLGKDDAPYSKKPAGFGLLFQEDVQPSDYNVIFSTSLSSASITLREALLSQFRVPVLEESISTFSLAEPLQANVNEQTSVNNAHINIGTGIIISITIEGKHLPLRNGRFSDLTALLSQTDNAFCQSERAEEQIASVIAFLTSLFALDTVFLSGEVTKSHRFIRSVRELTEAKLSSAPMSKIQVLNTDQQPVAGLLAKEVRTRVFESLYL